MRTLRVTNPLESGPDVVSLQRLLNQKGFTVTVDGLFGSETAGKVVEAKKRLHYPSFRVLPIAGPMFRRLAALLPDAPRLQLPENFVATHQTEGLPGFPAIDCFAPPRTAVGAPEAGRLTFRHLIQWDLKLRVGGWTCYYQGNSGNTYFLTHFGAMNPERFYAKGETIGTVGAVPQNAWASHIHEGKHKGRYIPELAPAA